MTPDCSVLSFKKVKMATESDIEQTQNRLTESTNIKCIIWSQKLKQGYRFHAWSKGKVDHDFHSSIASEISKKVSSMSSICELYFFLASKIIIAVHLFTA